MVRWCLLCLLTTLFVGCKRTDTPDLHEWLHDELMEAGVSAGDGDRLVMFVSEGMCAECVVQEIIRLNQSDYSGQIIVAGVFSNKRHFLSGINKITKKFTPLYIDKKRYTSSDELPAQPFYCIYNLRDESVAVIYNPF